MHFEAVKCVKKSLKDDEVFISVMCCSSIMSGNPPPGMVVKARPSGIFTFWTFFFKNAAVCDFTKK